jgi:soluble lytic murein transglycosylase-like protein
MVLLSSLGTTVWAEDRAVTPLSDAPQALQVSTAQGKIVVTNTAPNAPLLPAPPTGAARPSTTPVSGAAVVPSRTPLDKAMPASIQTLVDSISRTHGVDPRLVAAVMKVESNYNPWARSKKGALGLMQLIPATGQRFGVENFFDPAQNIEGGVRYLKFLSQKFGKHNLDLTLAAYNAGENAVERFGRVPPIRETVDYVRKIRNIYSPESGPALVSAASEAQIAPTPEPPPPKSTVIYSTVDERGVTHYSNMGPPN